MLKSLFHYFTKFELALWFFSIAIILAAFFTFNVKEPLTLSASLIGVTSLIFNAKGHPIGQLLMICFSLLYGIISFQSDYYGEMITYLGMTAPMALFAFISWIKHPYKGNKNQVQINCLTPLDIGVMAILTLIVTFTFYFILDFFHTPHLVLSTFSISTSFIAVYLTFKRSVYFSLAYAANDIILISLWILASYSNLSYLSVVICFIIFLINDSYCFINWLMMQKQQHSI